MSARRRIAAGAGLSIGAALAVPAAAQADDFPVTNLNDLKGSGSLRDAVNDANNAPGADRILFASKLTGTITLNSDLYIDDSVEIVGPGARLLTVRAPDDDVITAYQFGTLEISGLTIGDSGGDGIDAAEGDLEIERSAFSGNDDRGVSFGEGDLTVRNSTMADNGNSGLGVEAAIATVENSTLSGNGTGGFFGPGITLFSSILELESSTVTANDGGNYPGGGIYANASLVESVVGTIIAGNSSDDGSELFAYNSTFEDVGFSVIGDPGDVGITSAGGNLIGADPNLGALRDNGGPTDTHALGKGSPAKNAGHGSAPKADQRGAPRKGKADIGAYELVKCGGAIVDMVGTSGKDRLRGDGGRNGILGLGGKDRLKGIQNRDGLCGGGGKDKLAGGSGRDKLFGEGGKDVLKGGKATDKLNGGPGDDKCVGGSGPGTDKQKSC